MIPYSEDTIREWKSKGFRNGRFHLDVISMVDFERDQWSNLKNEYLDELREICNRFVRNRIPVTISFSGSEPIINGMKDDRKETFGRTD